MSFVEPLVVEYGAPVSHHDVPHAGNEGESVRITVNAMSVASSQTLVTVLWQDGTLEEAPSSSFIPHHNLDDLDCWYIY
jgi:hypothetical protein